MYHFSIIADYLLHGVYYSNGIWYLYQKLKAWYGLGKYWLVNCGLQAQAEYLSPLDHGNTLGFPPPAWIYYILSALFIFIKKIKSS